MGSVTDLRDVLAESGDRQNPDPPAMQKLLEEVHTIAVVGISRNPEKPARRIPSYLASKGYEILPVNPAVDRILGRTAFPSLQDIVEPIDLVLVFRPSEEAARIVEVAMNRPEAPVIWLQEGIRADEAAALARARGLTVVQDLCVYRVHRALGLP